MDKAQRLKLHHFIDTLPGCIFGTDHANCLDQLTTLAGLEVVSQDDLRAGLFDMGYQVVPVGTGDYRIQLPARQP